MLRVFGAIMQFIYLTLSRSIETEEPKPSFFVQAFSSWTTETANSETVQADFKVQKPRLLNDYSYLSYHTEGYQIQECQPLEDAFSS